MGSSAAALTAGVVIADQLLELDWKPLRILDEAARLEGHPDNVAAVHPGFDCGQRHRFGRRGARGAARPAAALRSRHRGAGFRPAHHQGASVLPTCYSKEDAVFNVQRAALLMAALATGSTWAFPTALEDRFHQPYRVPLVPGLDEILKLRAPGIAGMRTQRRRSFDPGVFRTGLRGRVRPGAADLPAARPRGFGSAGDAHRRRRDSS